MNVRDTWPRILSALLSVFLLVTFGVYWWKYHSFSTGLNRLNIFGASVARPASDIDGKDQNILIVGNDDRETATDAELRDLEQTVARIAADGLANRFGAQRFGAGGDNAAVGLALLRGQRRERDRRKRRLLLSALQSAVFNRALELRAAAGPLTRLRGGDVLQKTDTGGLFITTDLAVDQAR